MTVLIKEINSKLNWKLPRYAEGKYENREGKLLVWFHINWTFSFEGLKANVIAWSLNWLAKTRLQSIGFDCHQHPVTDLKESWNSGLITVYIFFWSNKNSSFCCELIFWFTSLLHVLFSLRIKYRHIKHTDVNKTIKFEEILWYLNRFCCTSYYIISCGAEEFHI